MKIKVRCDAKKNPVDFSGHKNIRSSASGILEWRCAHPKCSKRIYSLYKRQLEANARSHLKTHDKDFVVKVRRVRGHKIQTDKLQKT